MEYSSIKEMRKNKKRLSANAQLKEDVSWLDELVKLQRIGTDDDEFTKTSVEAVAYLL